MNKLDEIDIKNAIKKLEDNVDDLKKKYKKIKKKHDKLQNEVKILNKVVKDNIVKNDVSKLLKTRDDIFIDRIVKGEDTCSSDLHDIEVRWN